MTVLTADEMTRLSDLASKIEDETVRSNALSLLERMNEVIEGVGDRPITWQPTAIKILQALSNTDNITDGGAPVAPGSLVAGSQTIPNGLRVIPLALWQSRSLWDSNTDNTRRLCSSPDAKLGWQHGDCYKCDFGNSKEEGKAPPCNKEFSFLVIADDLSDMFRLTFSKSQYRCGMDWQKEVVTSRTHPYKRVYALSGETSTKKKTVKEIRARLLGPTRSEDTPYVTPAYLDFLHALYEKQTNDRKQYLTQYHADIQQRLLLRANGSTGHAIEHHSEGETTTETSSGSGGYVF